MIQLIDDFFRFLPLVLTAAILILWAGTLALYKQLNKIRKNYFLIGLFMIFGFTIPAIIISTLIVLYFTF